MRFFPSPSSAAVPQVPRRMFLQAAGAMGATAALALAGCGDDTNATPADPTLLRLGQADIGLLNYAYVLEQLTAAFYQQVLDVPATDLQAADRAYLNDLRDHEIIHREAVLFALGTSAVPMLSFDFSSLTLTTRAGVLSAAKTLEDLVVAAYNGLLPLLIDTSTLALLTKISSVEARHAAFVSDLITPGSFAADTVVNDGPLLSVGVTMTPAQVVAATAAFFLPITVNIDSLPTA